MNRRRWIVLFIFVAVTVSIILLSYTFSCWQIGYTVFITDSNSRIEYGSLRFKELHYKIPGYDFRINLGRMQFIAVLFPARKRILRYLKSELPIEREMGIHLVYLDDDHDYTTEIIERMSEYDDALFIVALSYLNKKEISFPEDILAEWIKRLISNDTPFFEIASNHLLEKPNIRKQLVQSGRILSTTESEHLQQLLTIGQ